MLETIIGGEESPKRMADLALGHLRLKLPQLQTALECRFVILIASFSLVQAAKAKQPP